MVGGLGACPQGPAAIVEGDELGCTDAERGRVSPYSVSGPRRVSWVSPRRRLGSSVAFAGVLDRSRLRHRVHCLRVAAPPGVADESGNIRVRKSGCGSAPGLFRRRRAARPSDDHGNALRLDQCGSDYHDGKSWVLNAHRLPLTVEPLLDMPPQEREWHAPAFQHPVVKFPNVKAISQPGFCVTPETLDLQSADHVRSGLPRIRDLPVEFGDRDIPRFW